MRRLFFFYGTLTHEHDNAMTRAVLPLLALAGRAVARGTLLAVRDGHGWYPVLRPGQGAGRGEVQGWLYVAAPGFGARALRMLDAYERADRRPGQREYRRRTVTVRQGVRVCRAQAYVHAAPAHAGMGCVPGGDFALFVARRGRRAWRTLDTLA